MDLTNATREEKLDWLLWAGVSVTAAFTIGAHEMWRDELQAWLIARDSGSIASLLQNLKYEGHPPLWYLLLMALNRAVPSPVALQYFQFVIIAVSTWIFVRYSPFPLFHKLLFAFGYLHLYTYGVIARGYSLGILLLYVVCTLFPRRSRHPIAFALLIALLAQTSIYGTIFAAAFLTAFFFTTADESGRVKLNVFAFACAALSILSAAAAMFPAPDASYRHLRPDFPVNLSQIMASRVLTGFLPLPEPAKYLRSFLIQGTLLDDASIPALGLLTIVTGIACRQSRAALWFFITCLAALSTFTYFKLIGEIRHFGHFVFVFLAALWLAADDTGGLRNRVRMRPRLTRSLGLLGSLLMGTIAATQFAGGAIAVVEEYLRPFSCGREAARFIAHEGLADNPMVGEADYAVSTVIGYLNKDRAYYVRAARYGSFVRWDDVHVTEPSEGEILQAIRNVQATRGEVVVVLNRPVSGEWLRTADCDLLREFTGAVIETENFYVLRCDSRSRELAITQ